jgi:hypothetical protein
LTALRIEVSEGQSSERNRLLPDDKDRPQVTISLTSPLSGQQYAGTQIPGSPGYSQRLRRDIRDAIEKSGGSAESASAPASDSPLTEAVQSSAPTKTASNDTFVGRFLPLLGSAFLTVPPSVSVAVTLKSENPNWYVVGAFIAGCWTLAALLVAAGLRWPKWKLNHEVLAKKIVAVSNSKPAWLVLLLLISVVPAALVGWLLHTRVGGYTQIQLDRAVLEATSPLQSKLAQAEKERDAAILNAKMAKLPPTPSASNYPQGFGTTCTYNLISTASTFWSRSQRGAAVLITAANDNEEFKKNLVGTLSVGSAEAWKPQPSPNNTQMIFVETPDISISLDAPHLVPSDQRGITVHGVDPQETLRSGWSSHFVVRYTSKVPEGLAEYYKVPSIVWIDIGPGSPWADPASCLAG